MLHLEISAQVAGNQTGLRYRWFAVSGGCNPQESDMPTTLFKFADGGARDRVSVEVWRGNKIVARSEIDVKLDELQAQLAAIEQLPKDLHIEITSVLPYEPQGGSDTRAAIAGKVGGSLASSYSVVLYARASDVWYVQPTAFASHPVRPDVPVEDGPPPCHGQRDQDRPPRLGHEPDHARRHAAHAEPHPVQLLSRSHLAPPPGW